MATALSGSGKREAPQQLLVRTQTRLEDSRRYRRPREEHREPAASSASGFAVGTTDRLANTQIGHVAASPNGSFKKLFIDRAAQFLTLPTALRVQPVYPYPWSPAQTAYQ
jgi:hypothetical protein